jgi:DNA-directed RNA polymerase specialized sigma24 family protein
MPPIPIAPLARSAAPSPPAIPPAYRHPLDASVFAACQGDRGAIALIARLLHKRLLDAVRRARRPYTQDADEFVQELFVALLERRVDLGPGVDGSVARLVAHVAAKARRVQHGRPCPSLSS